MKVFISFVLFGQKVLLVSRWSFWIWPSLCQSLSVKFVIILKAQIVTPNIRLVMVILCKKMKWAIACGWRETFSGSHIYLFCAANSFWAFSYWNEDHQNCIKTFSCAHSLAFLGPPGAPEVAQGSPGGPTGPQMVAKSSQKAKNGIKMVVKSSQKTKNSVKKNNYAAVISLSTGTLHMPTSQGVGGRSAFTIDPRSIHFWPRKDCYVTQLPF